MPVKRVCSRTKAAPAAVLVTVTLGAASCSSAPLPVSHIEDKARLDVPIAICRRSLAPGEAGDGGTLSPEAYWSVLLPTFHGFGATLAPSDADCVGGLHQGDPTGAALASPAVAPDDTIVAPAEDETQVVWLRAFRASDHVAAGPLALVRPRPSELDVYALGTYRGSARHSRFVFGRLATTRAVAANDDGCADSKVDAECESTWTFYLIVGGKIEAAAGTPAQRLRFGTIKSLGRVQYRLTTDPPVFDKGTVRIHERLQVRDSGDEDVRKAEGDRIFVLGPDGRLAASQDSLWAQVPTRP
ncbi:MAG: hypothetical protein FWD17_11115 [Polyangiaceae bacterium]|nr:hypothetical protein [Polyangiaceae bacterium]